MPRTKHVKGFIDTDVLTEARRRMHRLYDTFDTVMVAFSGGKDSLVCVHLALQTLAERGDTRPLKVVFRDEELIPSSVLDFVDEYRRRPDIDLRWYAVPLESDKYVLGASERYVQWDPEREWIRPKPEWALLGDSLGIPLDEVVSQYDMDELVARREKGKVAIITGVRSAESLNRFRAMTAKTHDNWINDTNRRVATVKPIFDWHENDVFRFFYDYGIRYCPTYDFQLFAREPLRVATPTLTERAKRFDNLRHYEPELYDAVVRVFPEMRVQERYYRELDFDAITEKYGSSFDGVQQWIVDHLIDPPRRAKAEAELAVVRQKAKRTPESYPPDYVLQQFVAGAFKRAIPALSVLQQQARREAVGR